LGAKDVAVLRDGAERRITAWRRTGTDIAIEASDPGYSSG
jgi:hypothetical protein